jgi:hypothetical protein
MYMGDARKSEEEVFAILRPMVQSWQACQYDLLTHNCCNFSKAMIEALECPRTMPEWVYKLAETGQYVFRDGEKEKLEAMHSLDDRHGANANWMFMDDLDHQASAPTGGRGY